MDAKGLDTVRTQLSNRLVVLRDEIEKSLHLSRMQSLPDLVGEVQDSGDASVGLEQTEIRNAQIQRNLDESSAILDAISRIDRGVFGLCERCGDDIEPRRLLAQPSARCCFRCQSHLERTLTRSAAAARAGSASP